MRAFLLFISLWLLLAAGLLAWAGTNSPSKTVRSLPELQTADFAPERVDLSGEKLIELPAELLNLPNLRSFSYKGGRCVGTEFDSLWAQKDAHLNPELLDLSQRKLLALPEDLSAWADLELLYLPNNRLSQLPASFCGLLGLQGLDLSGNRLQYLPAEFARLHNLQRLDLSHNRLVGLPAGFFGLHQLRDLDLSHNHLGRLGDIFCYFYQLQSLDLSNNRLTALPASVRKMQALAWLDLSGNPIAAAEREKIMGWLPRTKIIF